MISQTLTIAAFAAALATSAFANGQSRSGQFEGVGDFVTSGNVTVTKNASGYVVDLGPQFFHSGAPDPKVGFGINGEYVDGTLIGALQSNAGAQSYIVPASLDAAEFTDIFIWCEKYSLPLGVATIN